MPRKTHKQLNFRGGQLYKARAFLSDGQQTWVRYFLEEMDDSEPLKDLYEPFMDWKTPRDVRIKYSKRKAGHGRRRGGGRYFKEKERRTSQSTRSPEKKSTRNSRFNGDTRRGRNRHAG